MISQTNMYDCEIHGRDPWFPDLKKSSLQKFQDIGSLLFDIFQFPETYKNFPSIPENIFDRSQKRLSQDYSIIKKWLAYYIVYRWKKWGKLLEISTPFSQKDIAFSFSRFDFPNISDLDTDFHKDSLNEAVFNTLVFDILNIGQKT